MKALYIGNVSDDDASPTHSTENHVKQALRNLGHECVPVLERGLDWSTVPVLVKEHEPDMMLWTRTAGFDPADLEGQAHAIKSVNVPTVGFHLDRWVGLNREPDVFSIPRSLGLITFSRPTVDMTTSGGRTVSITTGLRPRSSATKRNG